MFTSHLQQTSGYDPWKVERCECSQDYFYYTPRQVSLVDCPLSIAPGTNLCRISDLNLEKHICGLLRPAQ